MQIGPKTEAALVPFNAVRVVFDEINAKESAQAKALDTARIRAASLLRALEAGDDVLTEWREAAKTAARLSRESWEVPNATREHRLKVCGAYRETREAVLCAFQAEHMNETRY